MGSSPLYLAIVVVWLIVLVPMLLRRDAADPSSAPARRTGAKGPADEADDTIDPDEDGENSAGFGERSDDFDADPHRTQVLHYDTDAGGGVRPRVPAPHGPEFEDGTGDDLRPAPEAPPRRYTSRARIIARRRRRTSGLVLLLALTSIAVAMGLGPWWVLAPPVMLLAGHLALLREAAKADAEHRAAEARYQRRRRAEARARRTTEAAREAEVIELMSRRNQVYDQYADAHLRAAGD